MTVESDLKKKVRKYLDKLGAYSFPYVGTGYGRSGIPDIIGCYKGRFFAIETKVHPRKPTDLQRKEMKAIEDVGKGRVWLLYPEDFLQFQQEFDEFMEEAN